MSGPGSATEAHRRDGAEVITIRERTQLDQGVLDRIESAFIS